MQIKDITFPDNAMTDIIVPDNTLTDAITPYTVLKDIIITDNRDITTADNRYYLSR